MNMYFILELSVQYVVPWYFLNNFKYIGCLYVIICFSKKLKQCTTQYVEHDDSEQYGVQQRHSWIKFIWGKSKNRSD